MSDSKGNYFTVAYNNNAANGDYSPSPINYTGNDAAGLVASNSVRFVYAARPDVIPQYQAGSLSQATVRFDRHQDVCGNRARGGLSRHLRAESVARSKVASIALCDASGACLPAANFGWQAGGTPGSFNITGLAYPSGFDLGGAPQAKEAMLAVGDFNGDGKTDLAVIGATNGDIFLSNGDGTFTIKGIVYPSGFNLGPAMQANELRVVSADINGDGKTDIVAIGGPNGDVFLSNSDGAFTITGLVYPSGFDLTVALQSNAAQAVAADINRDGRADIVVIGGPNGDVFLSNGDGTFTMSGLAYPSGFILTGALQQNALLVAPADVSGDGKTDIAALGGPNGDTFVSSGPLGDVITSITSGLGAATTITYQPLTSSSVYTKGTTAAYPQQDFQAPMYLVARVDRTDGLGGSYSATYTYAGQNSI